MYTRPGALWELSILRKYGVQRTTEACKELWTKCMDTYHVVTSKPWLM